MSTRNHFDDLMDLSLRHSLKNLVARKQPPASGRERLLAAAAQQKQASLQRGRLKLSFRFYNGLQEKTPLPGYGNLLDTVSILKANLLIA